MKRWLNVTRMSFLQEIYCQSLNYKTTYDFDSSNIYYSVYLVIVLLTMAMRLSVKIGFKLSNTHTDE